jgi:hypothetical protein
MPGPQTQHKGTVYGDDENAPSTSDHLIYAARSLVFHLARTAERAASLGGLPSKGCWHYHQHVA